MATQLFTWTLADLPDQQGRSIVVTGASSGLGAVVARELACAGAEVIMAVRDISKGERLATDIRRKYPQARLIVERVDVADLSSVRAFTRRLLDDDREIDVLVLNAGIGGAGNTTTTDGIELTFATNVVGHFAMVQDLLPVLEQGSDPRIVSVGSSYYRRANGTLNLDNLAFPNTPSNLTSYVRSKLANLLVALELDRRLVADGAAVRSLIVHPGMAATSIDDTTQRASERIAGKLIKRVIARPAEEGALPLLFAATAPQVPAGRFLGMRTRRSDKRIRADDIAGPGLDDALATQLWQRLEQATCSLP